MLRVSLEKLQYRLLYWLPSTIVLPLGYDFGLITIALPDIAIVLLVGLIFARRATGLTNLKFSLQKESAFGWLFVFCSILSSLLTMDFSPKGILTLIRLAEAATLLTVVNHLLREGAKTRLYSSLKVAALIGGLFSVFQFVTGSGVLITNNQFATITRTAGFAHGGAFGAILMTGFVLFVSDLLDRRPNFRIYDFVGIIFTVAGMGFTLTRTWLLASLVALFLYLIFTKSLRLLIFLSFTLGMLGLILSSGLADTGIRMLYGDSADVISERFSESISVQDNVRWLKWRSAIEEWQKEPLTGVGVGNIWLTSLPVANPANRYHSDNQWLDTLIETGVIGLGIFVIGLWTLFARLLIRASLVFNKGGDHRFAAFVAIYCGWLLGAFYWSITTGYVLLFLAFICAVAIHQSRIRPVRLLVTS